MKFRIASETNGFTLLLGLWLDLPGYAAFTSLFMLTAALPAAFQQATAHRAHGANTRPGLRAGLIGGAALLLAPLIGPRTGIPAAWVAGFALTVPALVLLGAWRGAAQRDGRAAAFGWSLLVEHGAKVALTLPLTSALGFVAAAQSALLSPLTLKVRGRAVRRSRVRRRWCCVPRTGTGTSRGGP